MKFLTVEGIGQVRGNQYDSQECYNKSLKLVEKERKLPQMMEVRRVSAGLIEINIDPCLQEKESIAKLIKELVEI